MICFKSEHSEFRFNAVASLAAAEERAKGHEAQIELLRKELEIVREEKALIQDDLRRLLGLKPRVIVQPAEAEPSEPKPRTAFDKNESLKIKFTPREAVAKAQQALDERNKLEDSQEFKRAIETFEEVLKT